MFRIILALLAAAALTACSGPRYIDYFPYFDDGTPKPKVAVMPVIDSTGCRLRWCLAEEVEKGIDCEFMNSGRFYVVSPREIGPAWGKASEVDLTGNDLGYAQGFRNTDFIVVLELIDRTVATNSEACQTLTLSVRVKVIDIRCAEPRIILHEVFKSDYRTTLSHGDVDGNGERWGTPAYAKTCCGLAHQRMIKSLTERLEEVIWRAK